MPPARSEAGNARWSRPAAARSGPGYANARRSPARRPLRVTGRRAVTGSCLAHPGFGPGAPEGVPVDVGAVARPAEKLDPKAQVRVANVGRAAEDVPFGEQRGKIAGEITGAALTASKDHVRQPGVQ